MTVSKICLRTYDISLPQLDNLASEFCGKCLQQLGPDDEAEYGFEDASDAYSFRQVLDSTFKRTL